MRAIEPASSSVGTQTETAARRRARSARRSPPSRRTALGSSLCGGRSWGLLPTEAGGGRPYYGSPWAKSDVLPLGGGLETGRDEELVATSRERPQAGLAEPLPGRPPSGRCARPSRGAGIEALWAHQADALEAARRGHAIVTTGTASGKSLAFNLPVLDTLASDLAARAFYLYPTKALAQDQARALARIGGRYLRHAIYDGDTPREERRADPPALQPRSSRTRTCCTWACCPTTAPGATCSPTSPGSWSTRRTCTAACSARTWPTCCAACAGSRARTGPSRASCSRARPSPTRSSSPSG